MEQSYYKDQWKGFKEAVHWKTLWFVTGWFIISYLIWGWKGLLVAFLMDWFMFYFNFGQGGFADKKQIFKTIKKTFYCNICKKEETVYIEEKSIINNQTKI